MTLHRDYLILVEAVVIRRSRKKQGKREGRSIKKRLGKKNGIVKDPLSDHNTGRLEEELKERKSLSSLQFKQLCCDQ